MCSAFALPLLVHNIMQVDACMHTKITCTSGLVYMYMHVHVISADIYMTFYMCQIRLD